MNSALTLQSTVGIVSRVSSRPSVAHRTKVHTCAALNNKGSSTTRRSALIALTAVSPLLMKYEALALIPDDDDEELVEKAKANRRSRLAEDKKTAKQFVQVEDQAQGDLVQVQRAVKNLAKSGAQLEAGDLAGVSDTVGGAWVAAFSKASGDLSTSSSSKTAAASVFKGIAALETSSKAGDLQSAKKSFVSTVSAFGSWADEAGISASLKGL